MDIGKITPVETINFPGFQKILDFTATGTESSISLPVNGDVDKEYKILLSAPSTIGIKLLLNNNSSTSNNGIQYLQNSGGTISAARATLGYFAYCYPKGITEIKLVTASNFQKTGFHVSPRHLSGTTIDLLVLFSRTLSLTDNITTLDFLPTSGNFTSGSSILVYARRSN